MTGLAVHLGDKSESAVVLFKSGAVETRRAAILACHVLNLSGLRVKGTGAGAAAGCGAGNYFEIRLYNEKIFCWDPFHAAIRNAARVSSSIDGS
jgi:hypothetical protein